MVEPSTSPTLRDLGLSAERPLVLVDVDEVLGLFMQGFGDFLAGRGLEMRIERFALFQNIYRPGAAEHLDVAEGRRLFDAFFAGHCHEIEPAPGIQVVDNGCGIDVDTMTRLFQHGFTTKTRGHGFGLHACALAAAEMDGTLTCHSEGPGRGATFVLDIPFEVAEPARGAA